MPKELFGIGRGYLLAFLAVIFTAVLTTILMITKPGSEAFVLDYWKDFLTWFVVPIVFGKELGKIGSRIGKK